MSEKNLGSYDISTGKPFASKTEPVSSQQPKANLGSYDISTGKPFAKTQALKPEPISSPQVITIPEPIKTSGFFAKSKNIKELIPDHSKVGMVKNTLKFFPRELANTLTGGILDFLDTEEGQQAALHLTWNDIGKSIIPSVASNFLQPVSDFTGKDIKLKSSLPSIAGDINIQSIQNQTREAVLNGENPYIAVLKATPQAIFDGLMLAGLAQKTMMPRENVIATGVKTDTNVTPVKSFRLSSVFGPEVKQNMVPTSALDALKQQGVNIKYNPNQPTFFRQTVMPNGTIRGQIIQLKPSLVHSFISKFKGNINNVPDSGINIVYSGNRTPAQIVENITGEKVPVVPVAKPTPLNKTLINETQEVINQVGPIQAEKILQEELGINQKDARFVIEQTIEQGVQNKTSNIKQIAQDTMQQVVGGQKVTTPVTKKPAPKPESIIKRTEPNTLTHATDYDAIYDILKSGKIEARIPRGEEMTTKDKSISFSRSKNIETFKNQPIKIIVDKDNIPKTKPFGNKIEEEERLFNTDLPISSIKRIEIYKNPYRESAVLTEQKVQDIINLATSKGVEVVRYDKPAIKNKEDIKTETNYRLKPVEKTKETTITLKGKNYKLPKQLVTKTQVKSLLTNIGVKELNLTVIEKDGRKMLNYQDDVRKMNIVPSALGLIDENLEVGKTLTINKDDLKKEGTSFRAVDVSGGELGSVRTPQNQKTIDRIIENQKKVQAGAVQEVPADFKISARAKQILEKYGASVGERSLSKRLLGVYKPLTKKVRVQSLYDITTVTHEAIHLIDDNINFSKNLIESTGRGAKIRNQLTDIYEDIYPGAKRTHKLETRIKEGLAVLFENYFYDPASIKAEYPELVKAFIEPDGEFYNPQFTELLDDMNSLVSDYAQLTPEQRIGSRIRTGKEVVEKQTGFTRKQRLEYEIFNKFEPLKRYGNEAGVAGTESDPYVQAFNIMNKNSLAASWINGKQMPVLKKDGNFDVVDGSVQQYMKMLDKTDVPIFRSYLVARRVVEDTNLLNELKNTPDTEKTLEIQERITKLQQTLDRDKFSLQDATAVVEKYADKFKEVETIYDRVNRTLLDMSYENGLLTTEQYEYYKNGKGYTSFSRFIDEELQSIGTIKTSSKSKVTSFKERTGSELDIIDPIYSQVGAINEVIGKALENRLWLKVADIANKNVNISRRFEKIKAEPVVDAQGKISFPQEKDPNIIRIFRNGKREFYRAGPEFIAVAKQLKPKEMDTFAYLLRIPASVFTRLTTSANPLFAVGNLAVDQFTGIAQTKAGFKPVVDPAKSFYKYITSDKGIAAYKAIGGDRQNLASFYKLSPDEVANRLAGGVTAREKVANVIDSGISLLEIPSNMTEIMTRYSEFARAKEMGKTDSEALFMSSQITTPFQLQGNLGGRVGQEWVRSISYLNSIIQVLYKHGNSIHDNPKRVASVAAGILAAGLTLAISLMEGSSEEQKRLFTEQPVRNMSRYLYIPSPNGKALIRIRVPEQLGVYTGMAYLYIIDNYDRNEAVFKDYLDVVSSTVPEQIQLWNPGKALFSWLPQGVKPGVQTTFNFKVFPDIGPIVPYYMANRKPSEQYNAYTSRVAKSAGEFLNMSPAKFEFFIRNQFGAVGGAAMGKLPGNPIYIQEKEFVMTGRSYNKFYSDRELIRQEYQTMKDSPDSYTYEQQYEIKKDYQLYNSVSELLSDIGKINKIGPLPNEIKEKTYNLLLNIGDDENIDSAVYELQSIVNKKLLEYTQD